MPQRRMDVIPFVLLLIPQDPRASASGKSSARLRSRVSCFNFALERQTENLLGLADAAQDEIPE